MTSSSIKLNITAANIALLLLFGSACFHCCAKYFYCQYRLVFGTLFPAYSSYKAVKNRDVKEYSRWMIYWIVFALFSFAEVFADVFIGFWLPFYYETKILFVLWLMSPYGNGSKILYLHFIHPQLTAYEQTIDLYIDSVKQLGISSVWHLWRKVTEISNKTLLYFFQFTMVFYQMQNSSINERHIQSQRLLTQPNQLNFFQQYMFMRSPKPVESVSTTDSPVVSRDVVDNVMGPLIGPQMGSSRGSPPQNQLSQRWFSAETLNSVELNEETTPSRRLIDLRIRSESESNLDDWEKMEIIEVEGKPPIQPKTPKKKTKTTKTPKNKTKTTKTTVPSERPVRETRAAALKARAKCKEEYVPEEY